MPRILKDVDHADLLAALLETAPLDAIEAELISQGHDLDELRARLR